MLNLSIEELTGRLAQAGKVEWIGLRPTKGAALESVESVEAIAEKGLAGDHALKKNSSKRQVTLIMREHLDATANAIGQESIDPGLTRRNIVVSGINLLSLKGKVFKIGDAELELTDECHPCSRMEQNLGFGGYNAMRGHGGWCAVVRKGGQIRLGDEISF